MEDTIQSPQGAMLISDDKSVEKPTDHTEDAPDSEKAIVKRWTRKIQSAKERWADDFDRMRENMDFVAGIQWPGQKSIRDKNQQYICNLTLRAVNQGVATLYARDPKVAFRRRKRLNYHLWDGKMESIQLAMQIAQLGQQIGLPVPPDIQATIQDFKQGRMAEQVIDRIGETMRITMQYQIDEQDPNFKLQMKQLVRRVNTCGVGYIKVMFCREYEHELSQSANDYSALTRSKMVEHLIKKHDDGKLQDNEADVEKLKSLTDSIASDAITGQYQGEMKERLVFDFPQATSIIPDPNCRCLKGFVGARWIVEEFFLPLDYVNSFFGVDIKSGGSLKTYDGTKKDQGGTSIQPQDKDLDNDKKKVCVWRLLNRDDNTELTIVEGWDEFVQRPEVPTPQTRNFWNIFPVTFNDIETEDGCRATVFPPSEVDLLFSPQTQWNETRNRMARHRLANGPRYLYPDGSMSEADLDSIKDSEDQEFIKLKGVNPGTDLTKIMVAFPAVAVNPAMYDTRELQEDALLATGQQEANMGPAQSHVTATVGTISEQSRVSVAASNVDGLDDALSEAVKCGGEMLLREMSPQTVQRIAGVGAVFPQQNREDYINEVYLETVAASSGRPNKALEITNWERVAPILSGAGANPQAIIRETLKRLDDNIEPADFFPLPGASATPTQPGQPQGPADQSAPHGNQPPPRSNKPRPAKPGPSQPPMPTKSGAAVPLAGYKG